MTDIDHKRAGLAWTIVFAGCAILASWVSVRLLAGFIAIAAGTITFFLGRRLAAGSPAAGPVAAALAAASFPVWLWVKGEAGLMWAASAAVVLVASALVSAGRPQGATSAAGILVWLPIYVGYGLSFTVLIRQQVSGQRLLVCLGLILVAIKASALIGSKMGIVSEQKSQTGAASFSSGLAAVAAAEVAAMVSLAFLDDPFSAGPLAILGVIVALAATLGDASGRTIAANVLEPEPNLFPATVIGAWVIALPAFFYGFRLYLT